MKQVRTIMLLTLLCLAILAFSACVANEQKPEVPVEETPTTHTVVDTTGAEIEVPLEIDSVVIISTFPLASVYCMVVDGGEYLTGLTASSLATAENSLLIKVAPGLSDAATGFADSESVNVEEVMTLAPDVVFYNANDAIGTEAATQLTELGVPCVGFNPTVQGGDVVETFNAWVTLLGEIMGENERASKIVAYGREIQDMVAKRVANVTEDERKSALIISNYTPKAIMAAGTTFGAYWLSAINAKSVTDELKKPQNPVDLEQIYAWNPDVIFLNSFSAFTAEDLINSSAVEGQDWSGLQAVKSGGVYKVPLGMYYWFAPCSDSPLALVWFAKTLYPEHFADLDFDTMVRDYYSEYYGLTLTDEQLATIFAPPAESAMQ